MVDQLLKQEEEQVRKGGKTATTPPLVEDGELATIDKESEASEPSTPIKVIVLR